MQTPDSTPNLLIEETSPYLLQHAYNPVAWHPWGEAALQLAKDLDKPILVSIGYAACHWCHVMERESFEDLDTAKFMNKMITINLLQSKGVELNNTSRMCLESTSCF